MKSARGSRYESTRCVAHPARTNAANDTAACAPGRMTRNMAVSPRALPQRRERLEHLRDAVVDASAHPIAVAKNPFNRAPRPSAPDQHVGRRVHDVHDERTRFIAADT